MFHWVLAQYFSLCHIHTMQWKNNVLLISERLTNKTTNCRVGGERQAMDSSSAAANPAPCSGSSAVLQLGRVREEGSHVHRLHGGLEGTSTV